MTTSTNKKSFILYADFKATLDKLTDQQAGTLFKLITNYANDIIPDRELDIIIDVLFTQLKQQLDRDNLKWDTIKQKRIEAGQKGGLANASKAKQTLANVSKRKQRLANLAVNVNVNDTVNVNVNDTVINNNKKIYIKNEIDQVVEFYNQEFNLNISANTEIAKNLTTILKTYTLEDIYTVIMGTKHNEWAIQNNQYGLLAISRPTKFAEKLERYQLEMNKPIEAEQDYSLNVWFYRLIPIELPEPFIMVQYAQGQDIDSHYTQLRDGDPCVDIRIGENQAYKTIEEFLAVKNPKLQPSRVFANGIDIPLLQL
jgi:hypothetical protein